MQRRRLAAAVLAALTAALLTMPGVAVGAQANDQSLVRVAHFAPGLLKGDVYVVYVNGRLQLKGVPFKTVSDYLKVKPGKFKVEVREAGEPANSPPVVAATVELEAGKAYTVAVFGQLTSVQAALLTDDLSRPADSKSKVRLIQAIPGESAVDLVDGGDVLVSNAKFPSASDYQEVPAGSADLEVHKTGTGEVLAKSNNVKLTSGSISSLVAVGGIGEKVELLDINDAASAVSAAGGVATGAGGTSPSPSPGGRRFALLLLIGGGLAAATGFVAQQRRSTG
ncbi:MAG: DUF4397 domain-containing protein [Actinomycetes bacterium]